MDAPAEYDAFAWLYERQWQYWGGQFAEQVLPILDRLVLNRLSAGARVLDLCCGTGQLAAMLTGRRYAVTGLDASAAMLGFARGHAPAAEFLLADARRFTLPAVYDAALSMYDSLNHVLELDELRAAFRNVHAVLRPGAPFLFDLNIGAGYKSRWRGSFGIVEDDHVAVVRARYRPEAAAGEMDITLLRLAETWRRIDVRLTQRCYPEHEVQNALAAAGFARIGIYDGAGDFALRGGEGRAFFLCQRPLGDGGKRGEP